MYYGGHDTMGKPKLLCLGGCKEVGKVAFLVDFNECKVLLDYGIALNERPIFPLHISPHAIDGVLLSHAHLDHSGAMPLLFASRIKPNVYTTSLTASIFKYLISDMIKLSGGYLPYEFNEVEEMLSKTVNVKYNETFHLHNLNITPLNAGHVPGSNMYILDYQGFKVLFTGDFNLTETQLLCAPDINLILDQCPIHVLIVESTYGNRDHEVRAKVERDFINSVLEVINDGGLVLIPAFSYGRAQEILCVLYKYLGDDFKGINVYLDGMAKIISLELLKGKEYLKDPILYENALKQVKFIESPSKRKKVLKENCIIISPAGMLKGGPALHYAKSISKRNDCAIFLVSYQIPNTPGGYLLSHGKLEPHGDEVKCLVKWFDFSSHLGKEQLISFIRNIVEFSGNLTKVIIMHGDIEASEALKSSLEQLGIEALIPNNGDTLFLD